MILIDTSVIIDVLKNASNDKVSLLKNAIDNKTPCGISIFTYAEVLQGAKGEKEFHVLGTHLSSFAIYYLPNETAPYEAAAKIYADLRQKGKTIRSTIDLLIAQTAISNGLYLLHNDRDFDTISENIPDLMIYK
jgi:predicted nucleic acid-binding protein